MKSQLFLSLIKSFSSRVFNIPSHFFKTVKFQRSALNRIWILYRVWIVRHGRLWVDLLKLSFLPEFAIFLWVVVVSNFNVGIEARTFKSGIWVFFDSFELTRILFCRGVLYRSREYWWDLLDIGHILPYISLAFVFPVLIRPREVILALSLFAALLAQLILLHVNRRYCWLQRFILFFNFGKCLLLIVALLLYRLSFCRILLAA